MNNNTNTLVKRIIEILISISLFVLIYFTYSSQERIIKNNNQGYDVKYYYEAAKQVSEGQFIITGQTPYISRVGLHYLTGIYSRFFDKDIITNSMQINTFAIFLTVCNTTTPVVI